MLMLYLEQVFEEMLENLSESKTKIFKSEKCKKKWFFFKFTVVFVIDCSIIDDVFNIGCSSFFNECSSNAAFDSPWIGGDLNGV